MITDGISEAIGELGAAFAPVEDWLAERMAIKAAGFDFLRSMKFPETRIFLLASQEFSDGFSVITEVASGWFFKWQDEREQMRFSFASTSRTFHDDLAQVSFIACGIPDADGEIEIFAVDPNARNRDIVAPTGGKPYWNFFARRDSAKRFAVPEETP